MNKTELIERVAEEAGMTKAEAQKHFEAFAGAVTEALKGGEEVQITGFGKFEARERSRCKGAKPPPREKRMIATKGVQYSHAVNAFKQSIR